MKHNFLVISPNQEQANKYVKDHQGTAGAATEIHYDTVDLASHKLSEDVSENSLVIILADTVNIFSESQRESIADRINQVLALPQLKNAKVCLYLNDTTSNQRFLGLLKPAATTIKEVSSEKDLANHIDTLTGAEELGEHKRLVAENLGKYISTYKKSFFGHHHEEGRARQILNAVMRATDTTQIDQVLKSQVDLCSHMMTHPTDAAYPGAKTDIAVPLQLNSALLTNLKNIPTLQGSKIKSGYLNGIIASQEAIAELHNPTLKTTHTKKM